MFQKQTFSITLAAGFIFFISAQMVQAVPPPDFLFSLATQVIQFFSLAVVFLTAAIGAIYQFIKTRLDVLKISAWHWAGIFFGVLLISFIGAYFYGKYQQSLAYQRWEAQSRYNNQQPNDILNPITLTAPTTTTIELASTTPPVTSSTLNLVIETSTAPLFVTTSSELISSSTFFVTHQSEPLIITNEEFKLALSGKLNDFIVLDARENIEYEYGQLPNSLHIRAADLRAGKWADLPQEKLVYVMCWSGIRGKEVAEFLRSKKIVAKYLEKGADGWVAFGGEWHGEIKFRNLYTDKRYKIVYSTNQVKQELKKGIVLVDSREKEKFIKHHISGSINLPLMQTPTVDFDRVFAQIAPTSTVITVCDSFVNCFDAVLTGTELERRGHIFLGRYNSPWEM
ncbi:MAG: rhodanese-like domain-containing protein [Candidatus Falkowbacteria bacterium]